jgi:hypothetical protein
MSLDALRTAITAVIDTATPEAVTCAPHGGRFDVAELRRISAKAPAIFIAVLGFNDLAESSGSYEATISWAAFVVTRDKAGVLRDIAALNLVNALALIVPGNTWGLEAAIGTPDGVRSDNLFSATVDKAGVAMWAISWRQRMQLGQAITDAELATLDLFETFDARYPVEDDAPEAEDLVSLPQDGA